MSIPIPATMQTTRVTWNLGWTQLDTTGTVTDLAGAKGKVRFEPTAVAVAYPDKTVLPTPVETRVVDGVMAQVYLTRNDPELWNWRVVPMVGVDWEPFNIDVAGSGMNLAQAVLVPGKGPARVVKGKQGDQGASITAVNQTGPETVELVITDPATGTTKTQPVQLPRGLPGPGNTLSIGTVQRGENPAASITGPAPSQSLNLVLPRGEQGLPGVNAVPADEAVAGYVTATSQTRAALDTTYRRGVSAREFGAVADGVADDLPALQAAVDAAEGGTLFIPSGAYNMTGPLTVKSGTTIYGEPGTELRVGSFAIQMQGTAGPEIPFGAHAGSGDRSVTTATPHGLAVGDTVRIISQRDALSPDAGENWRLGYATPGAAVCYFSEFHQVMSVDSDTKVMFRTPILFPSYRADDAQEQYPGGRTTSIIQKIDTARSITIRDLSISSNYGTCIETRYAEDVLIESVRTYNRSRTGGAAVFFRDSLNCRAVNVRARYSTEELLPADGHQRRNTFKTTGTQNCGFDSCFVQNSSQCIDFTYDAGGTPSVFSYATNCEVIGSQDNAATAHGGTYGAQFTNNRFIECRMNGILNRSRSAVITGNTVVGRHFDDPNSQLVSYGIALYEGWARDCTVSGNKVHGFKSGITIWDAQDPGEWFQWVGAVITGNVVTGCRHGIFLHRSASNLSMGETGILIADNIIRASSTYGSNGSGIWVGPHYIGVVIQSNIINGMNNAADGIMVRPDAHYTRIAENRVMNFTAAGIRALGPTDPQIPVARLMPANNYYSNVGSGSSAHQVIGSGVELWSGANTKPGYVRVSRPTTLEEAIARLATLGMWA